MLEELKDMRWTWHQKNWDPMYVYLVLSILSNARRVEKYEVNLTSRNWDPVCVYLVLSILSRDWHRPNFCDNESTYKFIIGFLFEIWHKLIDIHALRKSAITFAQKWMTNAYKHCGMMPLMSNIIKWAEFCWCSVSNWRLGTCKNIKATHLSCIAASTQNE